MLSFRGCIQARSDDGNSLNGVHDGVECGRRLSSLSSTALAQPKHIEIRLRLSWPLFPATIGYTSVPL
jgi:hypothetical protein